jgi:hypothetical protein
VLRPVPSQSGEAELREQWRYQVQLGNEEQREILRLRFLPQKPEGNSAQNDTVCCKNRFHKNRIATEFPCASKPSISLKVRMAGSDFFNDFASNRTMLVRRWN